MKGHIFLGGHVTVTVSAPLPYNIPSLCAWHRVRPPRGHLAAPPRRGAGGEVEWVSETASGERKGGPVFPRRVGRETIGAVNSDLCSPLCQYHRSESLKRLWFKYLKQKTMSEGKRKENLFLNLTGVGGASAGKGTSTCLFTDARGQWQEREAQPCGYGRSWMLVKDGYLRRQERGREERPRLHPGAHGTFQKCFLRDAVRTRALGDRVRRVAGTLDSVPRRAPIQLCASPWMSQSMRRTVHDDHLAFMLLESRVRCNL